MGDVTSSITDVGVVIPCSNNYQYMAEALDSVIGQDFLGNIHIAIIDDCSSEENLASLYDIFLHYDIENKFRVNDSQVDVVDIKNDRISIYVIKMTGGTPNGPSKARNIGIHFLLSYIEAIGAIAFLDSDDFMLSNKLSSMIPCLDEPGVGAVYADYYHLYDDERMAYEPKEIFSLERFIQENIGPNCTSVVLKQALIDTVENNNFFDPDMRTCEDYDLFMRICEKYTIKHLATPYTVLRVHDKNSTSTVDKQTWVENRHRVTRKIAERKNGRTNKS